MTAGANDNLVAAALALLRPLAANVGTVGNWRDHWRALRPDCWESPRMQGLLQTRDKLPKPRAQVRFLPGASGFVRENAFLSRLFVTERRRVVVELTEVVKHERVTGVSTTLATAACLADPLVPHLLQCVAAEDALVAALLVSEPRIRRVLEAASCSDRNVRAMGVPCSSASHFRTSLTSS